MAPDFEIQTVAGKHMKLSDFRNKFVFLDFWGTWCGPCRAEIPNIKKMANTIPSDKLQVIGLAKDESAKLKSGCGLDDLKWRVTSISVLRGKLFRREKYLLPLSNV